MNYCETLKYLNDYVKQEIKEIMNKEIFKVGDSVYCIICGWGVVSTIDKSGDFPVRVDFKDESNIGYTTDGRYYANAKRTLSFTEYILENFSQERPIVLPEVGELCLVRNNGGLNWHVKTFKRYEYGEFICNEGSRWDELKRIKILD
jgi:hypothetical protein